MEFKVKRNDLINGLQITQSIVDKKSTMPILANALFEVGPDRLRISATDLEVGVISEIAINTIHEGKSTMPAKNLYEIAREIEGDDLHFQSKTNGWMEVKSGKSLFKIVQLNYQEFPSMPPVDVTRLKKIKSSDLLYLIEKTIYAVSTDETKYNLNGVCLEKVSSDNIRMVATDGHRLAYVEKPLALEMEKSVILPRKGLVEIKKILGNTEECLFGLDGRNAVIKSENATLIVRLIDGEFPDYKKVIPKNHDKLISITKTTFVGALKRVSLLSQDKNRGVKMIFSPNNLEIICNNPDLGEAKEEIEINYKGEMFEVGFNPRYFIDTIQSLSDEMIIIELKDEISPCVIRSEYDRSLLNVIMPMRL